MSSPPVTAGSGWRAHLPRVLRAVPRQQFTRYLVVGAWNTFFGYALYAWLTYAFTGHIPYAYMAASALGSIISITVAFFAYKTFVFRTKGNYIREYVRCFTVYSASILLNVLLLPVLVNVLDHMVAARHSPYIAGAVLTAGTVLFSFVGHRKCSFRP